MDRKKTRVLVIVLALVAVFWLLDLGRFFDFEYIKSQQQALAGQVATAPLLSSVLYFLIYVLVTALSLPGAVILTLLGGALFGLWKGLLLVSFASSIGATCAFLVSRYLLRDAVKSRFSRQLAPINDGIARDGSLYLFSLRLVPVFPFFIINLLMGLTVIPTRVFYSISQIGMLPGTFVFVNAGTQLAQLSSLSDILSPSLLFSFALLGIFPLLAKWAVDGIKARKIYQGWQKPRNFDRNVIVIGAGSGGLVTAYIAAAVKAKVTLIEKNQMGGDCLNTGCVPSKALIRSAKFVHQIKRHKEFGMAGATVETDFAATMERVQRVVADIAPHDSTERFTALGVECIEGEAVMVSPWEVRIGERHLTTRSIVLAMGASPFVPPIPGLEETGYLTSDNVWELRELPKRMVVLGGGPIGSELAQAFSRLGSHVTQIEMQPRLLMREDEDVSVLVRQQLAAEGVEVLISTKAQSAKAVDGQKLLVCTRGEETLEIPFDQILVAVGRKPRTDVSGIKDLGIELTPHGTIAVDKYLRTNFPNIYAVGDVTGPYPFTHVAAHQAWYAAVNGLFGVFKKFAVDYRVIPWATFTEPEVARVGLNETEAKEQGIEVEVTRYGIDDLDRAIVDGEAHGFIKVLTPPGKDKILGVTIVGTHAGDLIAEYVMAMKHGLGLNKVLGTIHIYPTLAEANKFVAGEWKRANAPQQLLKWVQRFHAWRRGLPPSS